MLCERLHKVYHQSQAAMAEKEVTDKDHNKDTIAAFMAFIKQGMWYMCRMYAHVHVCHAVAKTILEIYLSDF